MSEQSPHTGDWSDDFLTRLREPPRPAFAAALYDRLTHEEAHTRHTWSVWQWPTAWPFATRAVAVTAALVVLLKAPVKNERAEPCGLRPFLSALFAQSTQEATAQA